MTGERRHHERRQQHLPVEVERRACYRVPQAEQLSDSEWQLLVAGEELLARARLVCPYLERHLRRTCDLEETYPPAPESDIPSS
jgi:hypothetical protein